MSAPAGNYYPKLQVVQCRSRPPPGRRLLIRSDVDRGADRKAALAAGFDGELCNATTTPPPCT